MLLERKQFLTFQSKGEKRDTKADPISTELTNVNYSNVHQTMGCSSHR
jgi:hypothetical protein